MVRPALLVFLATTACVDQTAGLVDGGPLDRDAGAAVERDAGPPDAGTTPCPPNLPDWEFSGASGARIRGSMRVFAVDTNARPIPDVTVVVEASAGRFERRTDDLGCAYFEHFGLSGPVDVHIFPSVGYAYQSDFGIDADLLVRAFRSEADERDESFATVTGTVTGLEQLGAIAPTQAAFAQIDPMASPPLWGYRALERRRESVQIYKNQAWAGGPGYEVFDFERKIDARRTRGLYLNAGRVAFPDGRFPAGAFELTHMGFELDLDMVDGERRDGVMIGLSHPVTATLAVDLLAFDPNQDFEVRPFIQHPGGGTARLGYALGAPDPSRRLVFSVPHLTGVIAGSRYGAVYRAETKHTFVTYFHLADDLPLPNGWPVVRMPSPPSLTTDFRASGRKLMATVSGGNAMVTVVIGQLPKFRWLMRVWQSSRDFEMKIPQVPAGFVDPIQGPQYVQIEWIGLDPSVDLTSIDDRAVFDLQWGLATNGATVTFGLRE